MAALVRIAPDLRAVFAPHVPLQFMDRRCLWRAHDVQGIGLVGVAAKAAQFEVAVLGIECVTGRRPPLRRAWEPSMRLRSTPQQRTSKLPGLQARHKRVWCLGAHARSVRSAGAPGKPLRLARIAPSTTEAAHCLLAIRLHLGRGRACGQRTCAPLPAHHQAAALCFGNLLPALRNNPSQTMTAPGAAAPPKWPRPTRDWAGVSSADSCNRFKRPANQEAQPPVPSL